MGAITVSENIIKRWVRETLAHLHIPAWPIAAGACSVGGISDILACGPDGRMLAFECKRGDYKKSRGWTRPEPTPLQKKFISQINSQGGLGLIVGPSEALQLTEYIGRHCMGLSDELRAHAVKERNRRIAYLDRLVERGI